MEFRSRIPVIPRHQRKVVMCDVPTTHAFINISAPLAYQLAGRFTAQFPGGGAGCPSGSACSALAGDAPKTPPTPSRMFDRCPSPSLPVCTVGGAIAIRRAVVSSSDILPPEVLAGPASIDSPASIALMDDGWFGKAMPACCPCVKFPVRPPEVFDNTAAGPVEDGKAAVAAAEVLGI